MDQSWCKHKNMFGQ